MRHAKITLALLAMVAAGIVCGQESMPVDDSARKGDSAPAEPASQPATRPLPAMDAAMYEALYAFFRGDIHTAFNTLDKAIDSQQPTENWYIYLPLYRRCVGLLTGTEPVSHERSLYLEKYIRGLKTSPRVSVNALVKVAVLFPVGPEAKPASDVLARIEKSQNSLWSEWARWQSYAAVAREQECRLVAMGLASHVGAWLVGRKILESQMLGELDKGIMRKWAIRALSVYAVMARLKERRYRRGVRKLRELPEPKGRDGVMCTSDAHRSLLPATMVYDRRVLSVIEGSYLHPTIPPQKVMWQFFKTLRDAGVQVPSVIPVDEQVYMKECANLVERLRRIKARDISETRPNE